MKHKNERRKKDLMAMWQGDLHFFILHPLAFSPWKSATTVGSVLGAPEKRNGNFDHMHGAQILDRRRDLT